MSVGLIGLGVMGRNLALNWRDKGLNPVVFDPWPAARDWRAEGVTVTHDLAAVVAALAPPRVLLLMIKAGAPVDEQIAALAPLLAPGDIVMDGGNSHYRDTARRAGGLADAGLGYLGIGISGGAEGARQGPAMMVGGAAEAWARAEPILTPLAARHDGAPCIAWFGDGGAGHFVKMVHNGIEYAAMQAIAEATALLTGPLALAPEAAGAVFARWARGPLAGYLVEITAEILRTRDPKTGRPIIAVIADAAGQKGTGAWCAAAGIDYAVPIPAIDAALTARQISALPDLRAAIAAGRTAGPGVTAKIAESEIETALAGTIVTALAQGLHLIQTAGAAEGWPVDVGTVARVWSAGSILRMALLEPVIATPAAAHPLLAPWLVTRLSGWREAWRAVVAEAAGSGVPAPVMAASLAYLEAMGSARLPTALIQAQRDRFGAHGFARVDEAGRHHGPWVKDQGENGS